MEEPQVPRKTEPRNKEHAGEYSQAGTEKPSDLGNHGVIESVTSCDTGPARQSEHNGAEIPSACTPNANNSNAAHNNHHNHQRKLGDVEPTQDSTLNPAHMSRRTQNSNPQQQKSQFQPKMYIHHVQKFELTLLTANTSFFVLCVLPSIN